MTRDSGKPHIARACLDGIILSIDDLFRAIKNDAGLDIDTINVDGGATANDLLMQNQATLSGVDVVRPRVIETTAYGAALAAGVGAGEIAFEQIPPLRKTDKIFYPQKNETEFYARKRQQWREAITRLYP